MFELEGASKRYGETVALAPLSLKLEPGQTLALLGPSGSGKTTLVRLMMGLEAPTTGSVRFDGQAVTVEGGDTLRRRIGYVVQGGGLFPHLTARENVELVARYLRWEQPRRDARIDELLELARLTKDALGRYPVQLSGGQAQRVSLMRALMLDPAALVLDEPLGALDPITRHELQRDLRRAFVELRKTVVLVTHDLGEAMFFADRIVLLRAGEVVQDGSPRELIDHPADDFVREFIQAHRSPEQALQERSAG